MNHACEKTVGGASRVLAVLKLYRVCPFASQINYVQALAASTRQPATCNRAVLQVVPSYTFLLLSFDYNY
eukprot:5280249-Pyramimonas_sp.AAC.1